MGRNTHTGALFSLGFFVIFKTKLGKEPIPLSAAAVAIPVKPTIPPRFSSPAR